MTCDRRLRFLPRKFMCLSYPQYTPQVEGQLRKNFGCSDPLRKIGYMLMMLTLIHQKGALSYEVSYGVHPELLYGTPPDIRCTSPPRCEPRNIAFNNTGEEETVMKFDSDSVNLYIDSCVTGGLTGFKGDFVEGSCTDVPEKAMDTTAGKTTIIGEGIAAYRFVDDGGEPFTLYTKMSYAPQSKYRLLSPQWIGIQERDNGTPKDKRSKCEINDEEAIFYFANRQRKVTIKHDPRMLVPVLNVNPGIRNYQSFSKAFCSLIQDDGMDVEDEAISIEEDDHGVALQSINTDSHLNKYVDAVKLINKNQDLEKKLAKVQEEARMIGTSETLSKDQTELLRIHERYNHVISIPDIQILAAAGHFPSRLAKCTRPACATCCYGSAQRKPWRSKSKQNKAILDKMRTLPGEIAHTDLMTSSVAGLIPQMVGFLTSKKFHYSSFFVDDRSDFTFICHQESTSATETILSKRAYEAELRKYGKEVRHYHADNGTYAVAQYKDEIEDKKQSLTFCGVGSHHQNGKAENRIKIICNPARCMLIHAMHRWPEVVTQALWPYALSLAADTRNRHKLDKNGFSPLEKLSGIKQSMDLKNSHTFGCPAYVLNASLQDHNSIPRWDERIRVGAYLGRSKQHASNVALILNLQTGHISPQFHVVFDDNFETVDSLRRGIEPKRWRWLATHKREYHLNDKNEIIDGTKVWTDTELESSTLFEVPKETERNVDATTENANGASQSQDTNATNAGIDETDGAQRSHDPLAANQPSTSNTNSTKPQKKKVTIQGVPKYSPVNINTIGLRRSPRIAQKKKQLDASLNHVGFINVDTASEEDEDPMKEIYTYKEAMSSSHKKEFVDAMMKEISNHTKRNHWTYCRKSSVPYSQILRSTWTFRIKRDRSTGDIKKFKARFCADGRSQEEGVNYFETYAPVVKWNTIRSCLTMSIIHSWHTRAIDFEQAYTQADCDVDIFLHLPAGFRAKSKEKYVLKLLKNLYGLKQGGYNFHEKLKAELTSSKRGFIQSESDPCAFYKKGIIVLCYVDDCLIFAQDSKAIDDLYHSLKEDFICTDEGEADGYLGVEIKSEDGIMTLKQPQLIKRIIELMKLRDANPKATPVVKPLLNKNTDGKDRDENSFHYRSAIGSLSYLAGCTRPDISMAVHQAAKFSNNPKACHDTAVKRIGKYLLGTEDKGLMYTPDKSKGLEIYVDADFAGGFDKSNAEDPASVYSRTGYIIKYANCPIIWKSKLQTEIALSTTEAEYIALSTALRETIPVIHFLREVSAVMEIPECNKSMKCTVFEDNNGALEMAKTPKMRPRTKHIAIKYHHFRTYIQNGDIKIEKIDTAEQEADFLTKPLVLQLFGYLRRKVLGW